MPAYGNQRNRPRNDWPFPSPTFPDIPPLPPFPPFPAIPTLPEPTFLTSTRTSSRSGPPPPPHPQYLPISSVPPIDIQYISMAAQETIAAANARIAEANMRITEATARADEARTRAAAVRASAERYSAAMHTASVGSTGSEESTWSSETASSGGSSSSAGSSDWTSYSSFSSSSSSCCCSSSSRSRSRSRLRPPNTFPNATRTTTTTFISSPTRRPVKPPTSPPPPSYDAHFNDTAYTFPSSSSSLRLQDPTSSNAVPSRVPQTYQRSPSSSSFDPTWRTILPSQRASFHIQLESSTTANNGGDDDWANIPPGDPPPYAPLNVLEQSTEFITLEGVGTSGETGNSHRWRRCLPFPSTARIRPFFTSRTSPAISPVAPGDTAQTSYPSESRGRRFSLPSLSGSFRRNPTAVPERERRPYGSSSLLSTEATTTTTAHATTAPRCCDGSQSHA